MPSGQLRGTAPTRQGQIRIYRSLCHKDHVAEHPKFGEQKPCSHPQTKVRREEEEEKQEEGKEKEEEREGREERTSRERRKEELAMRSGAAHDNTKHLTQIKTQMLIFGT